MTLDEQYQYYESLGFIKKDIKNQINKILKEEKKA